MKRLQILFAVLAIVCGISARSASNYRFDDGWYSYVSGDYQSTSSYQLIAADPGCVGGCILCVIHVKKGANGKPDPDALRALYVESNGFTVPGTYTHGIVQLKPC